MLQARVLLSLVLLVFAVSACAADKEDIQITKQPEVQQVKPKKPVKIKLKRSAKDEYAWELSGDDVDEIVATDRKLRKMLKVQ